MVDCALFRSIIILVVRFSDIELYQYTAGVSYVAGAATLVSIIGQ